VIDSIPIHLSSNGKQLILTWWSTEFRNAVFDYLSHRGGGDDAVESGDLTEVEVKVAMFDMVTKLAELFGAPLDGGCYLGLGQYAVCGLQVPTDVEWWWIAERGREVAAGWRWAIVRIAGDSALGCIKESRAITNGGGYNVLCRHAAP
jgi:hypothetical protein